MKNVTARPEPTATVQMVADDGSSRLLKYYLQTYESSNGTELFGVRVDKLTLDDILSESAETFAITEDRNKALSIISFLANGNVPPCVLIDMVDEWFSNEVWSTSDYSSPPPLPAWHTYHEGA